MRLPALGERALILAGGLGTRLQGLLPDCPKVLAPVGDRTFFDVLVDQLFLRGVRRIVLLLGNRAEQVQSHLAARRKGRDWPADLEVEISVEPVPLGTGGAVKLAERFCDRTFLLLNGDTYFDLDITALLAAHRRSAAMVTLAATTIADAGRYGRLELDSSLSVRRFREKDADAGPGLINAGVYLMEPAVLSHIPAGRAVSLEHDVFPALLGAGHKVAVSAQTGTFFDIGTPTSYRSFVGYCQQPSLSGLSSARTEP